MTTFSSSENELFEHLEVLEHAKVGFLDELEHDGQLVPFYVGGSTGALGWSLFAEIKKVADGDASVIRRAIVDLDLTVLDT